MGGRPPVELAGAGLVDEAVGEQGVDALGDGGAGEAGSAGEVGARDGVALPDQPQHRARAGGGGAAGDRGFSAIVRQ